MSREPSRLYKCRVDMTLCVLAKNVADARLVAYDSIYADLHENPHGLDVVCEINNMGAVPPGWMERIPYAHHIARFLEGTSVREFVKNKLWRPFNRKCDVPRSTTYGY